VLDSQNTPSGRVVAAIVHDTRRVLTVQRTGEVVWRPPAGDVGRGESTVAAARRYVRIATGFEIFVSGIVDHGSTRGRTLVVVRCQVSGVGSDIAPEIRAMRWLTRAEVLAQPRAEWTTGLLAALADAPGWTASSLRVQEGVTLAS
jgi:ADP-ribose pyrophosphatase YjhB (NUDIX family)